MQILNTHATMAMALRQSARTQTVLVSFNPNSKKATQLISALRLMDFLKIEDSPYDPVFVAKIRRAEKSNKHEVDVSKIWD